MKLSFFEILPTAATTTTTLLLSAVAFLAAPNNIPLAHAAPPLFVNGEYKFQCDRASMALGLLLQGGGGQAGAGSNQSIPIYCGPDNPTVAENGQTVVDEWDAYRERLQVAYDDFNATCSQLVENIPFFDPPPEACENAARNWTDGLMEINGNVAGVAPETVDMNVGPGGPVNEFFNLWNATADVTLQNTNNYPNVKYAVNRDGEVLSIGFTGGANFAATVSAGCAGLLIAVSYGQLYGVRNTNSTLTNSYTGILTCGVQVGTLPVLVTMGANIQARTRETGFVPVPTPPPSPAPSGAPSPAPSRAPTSAPNRAPTRAPTQAPSAPPTQAPSAPPTQAPPPPESGGPICFSGRTTVQVQGKEEEGAVTTTVTRMDQLQIGDHVKVHGGGYALVYSFGHLNGTAKSNFLQIHTTGKQHAPPLEISAEHLLYVVVGDDKATPKSPKIVAAAKVNVGDYLLSESGTLQQITSIRQVQRHGYFAPHTTTGNIVVSGVLASTYASVDWWAAVQLPDCALHWLQHGAAVPYRLFCQTTAAGACRAETYDPSTGFSPYNTVLFHVYQWQHGLSWILQAAFMLVVVMPVLVCTMLLGLLLSSPSAITSAQIHLAAAALLGGLLVWKKYMPSNSKQYYLRGQTEKSLSKPITGT